MQKETTNNLKTETNREHCKSLWMRLPTRKFWWFPWLRWNIVSYWTQTIFHLYWGIFFCSFCNTEIIHRIMGHDDPPFRPDLTSVEVRPEFVDLMVDCWSDDPEERPHFFRIVDRLKKISGRYNYLSIFINITRSLKLLVNLAIWLAYSRMIYSLIPLVLLQMASFL